MRFTDKDIAKFWSRVDKSVTCWTWTGAHSANGYGEVRMSGIQMSTHRVAWIITNGDIPNGLFVLHSCDNKMCVNPSHLHLGTNADNAHEAVVRGRMATGDRQGAYTHPETVRRGQSHCMAILTEQQVIEIRNSGMKQRDLAKKFGVHFTTISDIIRRKSWTHI